MRGLTKAAALLSSTVAQAFVVPEPASSPAVAPSTPVVEPVVEYHASKAILSFDENRSYWQYLLNEDKNLTIEINSSERPCGENNVTFLGHELQSVWDGTSAKGEIWLPTTFPPILANWQVHCLYNSVPSDGSNSIGENVAQVLSFDIEGARKDLNFGFTVSYKQIGTPTFLKFTPHSTLWNEIESNVEHWRTPSPAFIPEDAGYLGDDEEEDEDRDTFVVPGRQAQKSLSGSLEKVAQYLKQQLTTFRKTAAKVMQSCHTHLKNLGTKIHKAMAKMCPDHVHEQGEDLEDQPSTFPAETSPTTNQPLKSSPNAVTQALPPAKTRSIHTPTSTPTSSSAHSSSTPSFSSLSSPPTAATHFLKLVSIAIILFGCLTYLIILIRDPRRRADRAAYREECRNKRLYRRAAWKHWWLTRFCVIRHRGRCPFPRGTGTCETWDEKRSRVLQQEDLLEADAQHQIRTLRSATRPRLYRNRDRAPNSLAAAEEGRHDVLYDSDSESSERRRRRRQSVTTLPGYESDGTLPPGYTTVVEDTPDSSVVSTSPRISRDGLATLTDSELEDGKSIEEFSLSETRPAPRGVNGRVGRRF